MLSDTEHRRPSMLWPELEDRRLKDPERQLLDAIAAGELDEHFVAIADAVHARRQLLHTVRSAKAIAELCVGDTVMFTDRIRPRYLEHELAEVTEVDDRPAMAAVGRFADGELRCPPLALRKLDTEPRSHAAEDVAQPRRSSRQPSKPEASGPAA